ncbi:MAG TPA: hypothetical protein DDW96_04085 [Synergistaceae bacterium]|nr:hypothetical protein [Synergistaceae bacterium]HCP07798.1 hypothetical protein [Synergistaceae bacterium]
MQRTRKTHKRRNEPFTLTTPFEFDLPFSFYSPLSKRAKGQRAGSSGKGWTFSMPSDCFHFETV